MQQIAIVIVNWNSAAYLEKCLVSIFKYTKNINFEVVVVDSASFDGSAEVAGKFGEKVQFIQLDENVGFAKANNAGFVRCDAEYILFLNPDTEIGGDALTLLISAAQKIPDCGAVGGLLLNTDGTVQTSCIQPFPTLINQFFDSDVIMNRSKELLLLKKDYPLVAAVDMVSGACLLVKSNVFSGVGMFSDDYFMYAEDLDLCYKIKSAGYEVLFTNQAKVVHHGGKSSEKKSNYFGAVLMRDSIGMFLKKFKGTGYARAYRIVISIAAIVRIVALLPLLLIKFTASKNSILKWFHIFAWSTGFERWVKSAGK